MAVNIPEVKPAEKPVPAAVCMDGALVPVGAAPIVPAQVAPARDYYDEPDDADDGVQKQHKPGVQTTEHGPSLTLIFGLAVVAITLAAVLTFYAIQPNRPEGTLPRFSTTATALTYDTSATNVTEDENADDSSGNADASVVKSDSAFI
ncbi:uncharacterized protein LOC119456851 [Dermacentor silvarum]|uniref:uncharacterized protein LOC119456851 n=1 Tax=Dermacentor silvarum TaxID=543639 RepID=UPI0018977D60|nr:uncharacterized protein LOC119456851 [Dermacentor silvarum]